MANKGDISKVALPNGDEYNFKDKYVRENYRALNNNDFDTINVTELNSGNIINTGAARFLNTINGSISGNAATATKATQDESGNNIKATYASSFSISDHTITLKNKNGASLGTVTIPDNNTTYTLGTSGNNVTLTPSSGSAQSITVPYATSAGSATDNTKVAKAGDTMSGTLNFTTTSGISYQGTKATYTMISFKDNANDNYGNGIVIGGGGLTVVGGGESAGTVAAQYSTGGDEILELASDGNVYVRTNVQSGYASAKVFTFSTDGSLTATKFIGPLQGNADTATTATTASKLGTNAGSATNPVYFSDGVPVGCTYSLNKTVPSDAVFTDHYDWTDITNKPTSYIPSSGSFNYIMVTRGSSKSTASNGFWAAMCNTNSTGSPTLPTSGKWWHVLSMDWTGNDVNNWYSQLALPTQDGNSLYYRHNLTGASKSSIDDAPWVKVWDEKNLTNLNQLTNGPGYITGITSTMVTTALGYTPPTSDTNYYHTTGSWSGLTYTATANGGAGALAFTIPTGTTATTVAVGNHTHKYAGSSSTGGAANSANQLNDDTSYINSGTAYVTHTDVSVTKTYLSRYNNMGINSSNSAGCFVLASNWSSTAYNCELSLGMGDALGIYYRGKNNGTYTSWQAVGRFSATPTSGQVVITDGTTGGMKSSGYTIAKSVPSNAVFTDTDTKNTAGSTDTSSKIFLIGATSQAANPQTYSDNEIYVTSGVLTTKSVQVGDGSATMQYNSTLNCIDFVFAS